MAKKAACKAQLRSRMRRARTRHAKGVALGAYQKCIRGRGRRSIRGRRGKHYKYWKGGWGDD